jgi:hypothetical protein
MWSGKNSIRKALYKRRPNETTATTTISSAEVFIDDNSGTNGNGQQQQQQQRQRVKSGNDAIAVQRSVLPLTVDVDCLCAGTGAVNSTTNNHVLVRSTTSNSAGCQHQQQQQQHQQHAYIHHRSSSASPHTSVSGLIDWRPPLPPPSTATVPSRATAGGGSGGLLAPILLPGPLGRRGSVPMARLSPLGTNVYIANRHDHPTVFDFEDWHTALDASEYGVINNIWRAHFRRAYSTHLSTSTVIRRRLTRLYLVCCCGGMGKNRVPCCIELWIPR